MWIVADNLLKGAALNTVPQAVLVLAPTFERQALPAVRRLARLRARLARNDVPVIFVDTLKMFAETLAYRETLVRLQEGVSRAAGKGARESVVLVDGTAFVVSVKNRTVITAVDPGHMRDHVFTNIDSAVIA